MLPIAMQCDGPPKKSIQFPPNQVGPHTVSLLVTFANPAISSGKWENLK